MSRTLLLAAHPDPDSFGAAVAATYRAAFGAAGSGELRMHDLAQTRFDPVLRFGYRERMEPDATVDGWQDDLRWAEHLVIEFPVWWTTFPATLTGWFDRVLTPGIAFRYESGRHAPVPLLGGRTASLLVTSRAPGFYTRYVPNSPVRLVRRHILGLCGIRTTDVLMLGGMELPSDTPERRNGFLSDVRALAHRRAKVTSES